MTTKNKQLSRDIEAVRQPLEAWRRTRQAGDRIPQRLWKAMTKLAKSYGVSPVSSALGVEYYALRDRVVQSQKTAPSPQLKPPAFIEVKALPTAQAAGCVVELEEGDGRKMTLRWDAGSGLDALALIQAFWRRAA